MSRKDRFLFLLVIFCHHVKNAKDKNKKKNMHADREKNNEQISTSKDNNFSRWAKDNNSSSTISRTASNIQALNQKQKKLAAPSMLFLLLMTIIKT